MNQATIARLEEDLAAANQRLDNANLNTTDAGRVLEETQAALRQAQSQVRNAEPRLFLTKQIAIALWKPAFAGSTQCHYHHAEWTRIEIS